MTPSLQLLIEIIQKDTAQERRKRSALRHSFRCLVQPAIYDNSGPKVFPDKFEDIFVSDSPGDQVHQSVVVNRIKELLKVGVHSIGGSSLNILQYLSDRLMCRAAWSETKTGFGEMGIKNRTENTLGTPQS